MIRQLLLDFGILIGCRWSLDCSISSINGTSYSYAVCTRFTVSERTLRNALGDLTEHIEILRGTCHNTADDLVNYKLCKEKWRVPDAVTDTSYGWEQQGQEQTSRATKRNRF